MENGPVDGHRLYRNSGLLTMFGRLRQIFQMLAVQTRGYTWRFVTPLIIDPAVGGCQGSKAQTVSFVFEIAQASADLGESECWRHLQRTASKNIVMIVATMFAIMID